LCWSIWLAGEADYAAGLVYVGQVQLEIDGDKISRPRLRLHKQRLLGGAEKEATRPLRVASLVLGFEREC
jgi:hypothetical protein